MQVKYTKYQKRVLSTLATVKAPTEAFKDAAAWCLACDAASTARLSDKAAYCSKCQQPTLVLMSEDFEILQPALKQFAQWLAQQDKQD